MIQNVKDKRAVHAVIDDSERARRASEESSGKSQIPNPEVPVKNRRRRFTSKYKLSIVQQADACVDSGQIGALLRREGLYSSHLSHWRRLYKQGALDSLSAQKRGPKVSPGTTEQRHIGRLEKRIAKLERELEKAHTIIDVQKKLSLILSKMPQQDES